MMNRKKQDISFVRISDEEYTRLENKLEALKNEFAACKRKLSSKCEALLILSQELDQCRSERDQFKLMAEQLRERCQTMKRGLSGQPMQTTSDTSIHVNYTAAQSQNLARQLVECKEVNKSLQFEVDDLKQKLQDARGDIKLMREQIARSRVGTTDEGLNTPRHFPAHEREELVQKLEAANVQYLQLERDLKTVLDEKEEQVTERDVYKTKYERLNQELNYILKGDENRVVDIDALIMENKYLQERLKQMEEEKCMAMAAVSKYKSLIEKKKGKSSLKLGQSRGGGMIITQKQVQQVLESKHAMIPTQQAMSDLQGLAGALLDSVNDKNLALSHQRKTNKILGNRVAELEKKIKTLECAGLWNVPAQISSSLEKLKQDCDDIKTLIPRKLSRADSDRLSTSECDQDSELESVTPLDSTLTSADSSPQHSAKLLRHLELTDLDLLPTKEVTSRPFKGQNSVEFQEMYMDEQCSLASSATAKDTVTDKTAAKSNKDLHTASTSHAEKLKHAQVQCQRRNDNKVDTDAISVGVTDINDANKQGCEKTNTEELNDCQTLVHAEVDGFNEEVTQDEDDFIDEEEEEFVDDGDDDVIGNTENDDEMKEFLEETDSQASENVGLLLENVAKKMCNLNRQERKNKHGEEASHDGDGQHVTDSRDVQSDHAVKQYDMDRGQVGKGKRATAESHTVSCPLLGHQGDSVEEDGSESSTDQPHDVEC